VFTVDQLYGSSVPPAAPNMMDPSQVHAPSAAVVQMPGRLADGEPGAGVRGRAVSENPTTWLVLFLGAGLALFFYGTGRIG
jgi:hypothetical protein